MIGAILGDFVGSQFDYRPIKSKDFELVVKRSHYSDDSVMTIAVAGALVEALTQADGCLKEGPIDYLLVAQRARASMRKLGRTYPQAGYGSSFAVWLNQNDDAAYGSYGNGAGMRVSSCGFAAQSLDEARDLAYAVTVVSHNHPEGLHGAQATAEAVYLARAHLSNDEIKAYFEATYCDLSFTLDEIRPSFTFDSSCQGTVPYALRGFLEATSLEDAIRNVISLGGDSDTLGATVGGMAAAYFGVPSMYRALMLEGLDDNLRSMIKAAEACFTERAQGADAAPAQQPELNPDLAAFEQSVRLDPDKVRAEVAQVLADKDAAALRYGHAPVGLA